MLSWLLQWYVMVMSTHHTFSLFVHIFVGVCACVESDVIIFILEQLIFRSLEHIQCVRETRLQQVTCFALFVRFYYLEVVRETILL